MSDLTKRLRNKANTLCDEAANKIEALEIDVAKWDKIYQAEYEENEALTAEANKKREVLLATIGVAETLTKENEALKAEVKEWKGHYNLERQDVLNTVKRAEKAEAERDRLREALKAIRKIRIQHATVEDSVARIQSMISASDTFDIADEALNHKEG